MVARKKDLVWFLADCTVRVSVPSTGQSGTGFFVAPGWILTCAHNVEDNSADQPARSVCVRWKGTETTGSVIHFLPKPFPDLALVQTSIQSHPCVQLGEEWALNDEFFVYGYTSVKPYGDSTSGVIEGWSQEDERLEDRHFIKLKDGEIRSGNSGSPCLNLRTGSVCGVIKRTRGEGTPIGGRAIPIAAALERFDFLAGAQRSHHARDRSWEDLREAWERGRSRARRRDQLQRATGAGSPAVPNFIDRPDQLHQLRNLVLGNGQDANPMLITLRGMPGVGKTALAARLCHDPAIRNIFVDGIVWTAFGRGSIRLADKIRSIGRALGDSGRFYDCLESGTARLREILSQRSVLLVLDDIWDSLHVVPFLVDSASSRVLVTTRDQKIALKYGALDLPLNPMSPEQAVAMVTAWTGRPESNATLIATRVGCLPLALKLVGGRLREGMTGDEWLQNFQRLSQIKLGYYSSNPDDNLQVCFDVSFEQVPDEHQALYYALSIFPRGVHVPRNAAVRLWRALAPDLGELECRELLAEFARLALIEWDVERKEFSLHDMLHDYTNERLGDRWAATHACLLQTYVSDGQPWWQVDDDGYIYAQLAHHLTEAGRHDELSELLTCSPAWMTRKEAVCMGNGAYLADLEMALDRYKDPAVGNHVSQVVQLHTARQVVHSRTDTFTTEDLEILVWLGKLEEAVSLARIRPSAGEVIGGLIAVHRAWLAKGGPCPDLLTEALSLIDQGKGVEPEVLSDLAGALTDAGRAHDAMTAIRATFDTESMAEALAQQAMRHTGAGQREQAARLLREARELDGPQSPLGEARHSVVLALVENGEIDAALDFAFAASRVSMVTIRDLIGPIIAAGYLEKGVELAHAIQPQDTPKRKYRADALSNLAAALATAGKQQEADAAYQEALQAATAIDDDMPDNVPDDRYVPGEPRDDTRQTALYYRAAALARGGKLDQALQEALALLAADEDRAMVQRAGDIGKGEALLELVQTFASRDRLADAIAIARACRNGWQHWLVSDVCRRLAAKGNYDEAHDLIGLLDAQAAGDSRAGSSSLSFISGALPRRIIFPDPTIFRPRLLIGVAVGLANAGATARADAILDEALEAARVAARASRGKTGALRSVALAMARTGRSVQAEHVMNEVRALDRDIKPDAYYGEVLQGLVEACARTGDFESPAKLIDYMSKSHSLESSRSSACAVLAVYFARSGRFEEAFETARTVNDSLTKTRLLRLLARAPARLVQDQERANRCLQESIGAARQLSGFNRHVELRKCGQVLLEHERIEEARLLLGDIARQDEDTLSSAQAMRAPMIALDLSCDIACALARIGRDAEAEESFREARHFADTSRGSYFGPTRSELLSALAGALLKAGRTDEAESCLDDAVTALDEIEDAAVRIARTDMLAVKLRELGYPGKIAGMIDDARQLAYGNRQQEARKASSHRKYAVLLARFRGLPEALGAVADIDDVVEKWFALDDIAELLADSGRFEDAMRVAQDISDGERRSKAVVHIAGGLTAAKRFTDALRTVKDTSAVSDNAARAEALSTIAAALAREGQQRLADNTFAEALSVLHKLRPALRTWPLRELAEAMARSDRLVSALENLNPDGLGTFLFALVSWSAAGIGGSKRQEFSDLWERSDALAPAVEFGWKPSPISQAILREAIRIAGWQRAEYLKVYRLLTHPLPNFGR